MVEEEIMNEQKEINIEHVEAPEQEFKDFQSPENVKFSHERQAEEALNNIDKNNSSKDLLNLINSTI